MNTRSIAYWTSTGILAFAMLSGGVVYLLGVEASVEGFVVLGYPLYVITILGVWKVLGGLALLAPGFARVKEWAYAGIFFDVTGALVSHVAAGDYGVYAFHVVINVAFTVLVIVSWATRPRSRTLGALFPAPVPQRGRLMLGQPS